MQEELKNLTGEAETKFGKEPEKLEDFLKMLDESTKKTQANNSELKSMGETVRTLTARMQAFADAIPSLLGTNDNSYVRAV
jgi:hypothetical protein